MRYLAISFLFLGCFSAVARGEATDPDKGSEAAKTIFSQKVVPYAGSRQAVQDNLVIPMISGTPLKTIDGTASFTTSAMTTSNDPLIRVSVFANPPTGDIQRIIVEQDLTASGSYTSAAVFPVPLEASGQMIAAVCANGYVMCAPGTYSGCRFREWKADSTGLITSVVAGGEVNSTGTGTIASLSSCYCFNKGCAKNNNAVLNIDNITANVGGGILAAFLNAKTGMVVTGAQSTGTGQITYSGLAASTVPNGTNATMTPEEAAAMPVTSSTDMKQIQSYYNSSGDLNNLAESAKQQQMSAPNSIYNTIANASLNQGGSTVSCANLITPSLALNRLSTTQEAQTGSICTDHLVYAVLTQVEPGKFALGLVGTGTQGLPENGANCGLPAFNADLQYNAYPIDTFTLVQPTNTYGFDVASVAVNLNLSANGCNSGTVTARWNPTIGLNSPIIVQSSMVCPSSGAQYPNYSGNWVVDYDSQTLSSVTNLGCQQFEQDTKCTVQQEKWDNRPVIVNGLSTGFQLGQVCKDLMGPLRNVHYCTPPERLWFRQDKTFYCKTNATPYDFSGAMKRVKEIQDSSVMPTDRTATYTDGGVAYSFGVPVKGALEPCSQVCQTRIPTSESVMTFTGTPATDAMTSKGVTGQAWSYFYKDCEGTADGSWTCPVDAAKGEMVVTQCGCSSDMGSVIGALTAANEAAQDSICSKE